MARPPHEDPEYQRQIVGNYRQGLLSMSSQQQQQQQHLVHQQQQHHHQQVHQQLNAAIKPPLPASQQFHQSLNNNNNNSSSTGSGTVLGSNGSSASNGASGTNIHTSPLIHHNYTWSQVSPTSPQKHVRLSPRPSASYPYPSPNYTNQIAQQHHYQQQQQHLGQIQLSPGGATVSAGYHPQSSSSSSIISSSSSSSSSSGGQTLNGGGPFVAPGTSPGTGGANRSPLSPNRRTRGENKKCRKVYGMDHKEQWCTQCKWKKACSRFGD